jgi:hypothetical protein
MFFGKKKSVKCNNCNSEIEKKFNFCPYCNNPLVDKQDELKEFGMLGRNDSIVPQDNQGAQEEDSLSQFGLTDKLINSIMNSMMKSLDKQFKNKNNMNPENMTNMEGASIEHLPNGIKIRIGMPGVAQQGQKPKQKQAPRKQITEAQLEKMSKLPRAEAKTQIRRLSDKVIYELSTPGIESPEDIFISKLESGYEIKAIGKKKVYTNSIPISLPLKGFSFDDKKLLVEFKTDK